ncbi:MAG: hypothetical protein JWO38_3258 [Gemmataceae bacterium]|nr:hypothetical protein [Gemmataceae bacterium]
MKAITHTFVLVAPDCPVTAAVVPVAKGAGPTVAVIQYELLTARPYSLTLEDLIFETHTRRAGLPKEEAKSRAAEIRAALFAKPHACMRASPLPKKYGWGVHHDEAGRIALYGFESDEYRRFATGAGGGVEVVTALRSKRDG